MADPTKLVRLEIGRTGTPDTIDVRVLEPMSATETNIKFTSALKDDTDTNFVAPILLSVIYVTGDYKGYIENMTITALATDGLSATVMRGIVRKGSDYLSEDATLAKAVPKDSIVEISDSVQQNEMLVQAIQGDIATGKNSFAVGDETDSNIYIYFKNADANSPGLRYNKTTNDIEFSVDGTTWVSITTATGHGTTASINDHSNVDIAGLVADDLLQYNGTNLVPKDLTEVTGSSKTELTQLAGTTNIAESDTFFGATDATGAEMEELTDNSETAIHSHAVSKKGSLDSTGVTVTGTTTETTIFTHDVIGGTLGSNNAVRLNIPMLVTRSGTGDLTIRVKWGGTTETTHVFSFNSVDQLTAKLEVNLWATGATGTQKVVSSINADYAGTYTFSTYSNPVQEILTGSSTIDSTSNQTLEVTAQYASATNNTVQTYGGILEYIRS